MEAHIVARHEMITQGGLYTFSMSGVVDNSVVEAFKRVAEFTYSDITYESELMRDLQLLDRGLESIDDLKEMGNEFG